VVLCVESIRCLEAGRGLAVAPYYKSKRVADSNYCQVVRACPNKGHIRSQPWEHGLGFTALFAKALKKHKPPLDLP